MASEAPATRNRARSLRDFLAWAIHNGLLDRTRRVDSRRSTRRARARVFSDDELRVTVNGFDPTRDGRALRVLFLTGVRHAEVLDVRWSRIDMEKDVLTVPPEAEKMRRVRDELRRAW